MKLRNLITIMLLGFCPEVLANESKLDISSQFTASEKTLISNLDLKQNKNNYLEGFECKSDLKNQFTICRKKANNITDIRIKDNNSEILSEYSINCFEGVARGTFETEKESVYKSIIKNSIKESCNFSDKQQLFIESDLKLPDFTDKKAELNCSNNFFNFEKSNLDLCKAHDDQDNFLVRIKDPSKDLILAQVSGNCENPGIQESYFNEKSKEVSNLSIIKENIIPGMINNICDFKTPTTITINKKRLFKRNNLASKAYFNMANARFNNDDLSGALEEINRSINLNPYNSNSYNLRGLIEYQKGNIDSSLKDFTRAITLNPNNKNFFLNRIKILKDKKLNTQLSNDYDKILELDSSQTHILLERGILNIKLLKYRQALSDLSRYIDSSKNNSLAYRSRGILHLNQGNIEMACLDFDNSLKLGDEKTPKLLQFIDSKRPNICKNKLTKVENKISNNFSQNDLKDNQDNCDKNTFVKVDSKTSCFD